MELGIRLGFVKTSEFRGGLNPPPPSVRLWFQMAPKFTLLISSGSKKKEPRCICVSKAKASHSQRMWAEVSSFTPHFLHSGLSTSLSRWRCRLRVLCPVSRPREHLSTPCEKNINCLNVTADGMHRTAKKINITHIFWLSELSSM
jgi:hypothetical protein